MRLSYSDLTVEDKKLLCNGCGAKAGGWLDVPEFLFSASCDQHDFYYWRGGSNHDRWVADRDFYKHARKDANAAVWWKVPFYHLVGLVYFTAVRLIAWNFFSYGKQKTLEDLQALRIEHNIA